MSHDQEVQVIFDKVIAAKLYDPVYHWDNNLKTYMCNSLKVAVNDQVIDQYEANFARTQIINYLGSPFQTLAGALYEYGYHSCAHDRLAIYKDWANRPQFPKESS